MKKPLLVLAVCAGLMVAAYAAPAAPANKGKATVGEFAVQVASALGYSAPDSKSAVEVLKGRGVSLAADLSVVLTEGEAARILSDLGLTVAPPANPNAPVSMAMAGVFAGAIATQPLIEGGQPQVDPPVQCLSSKNRGLCNECCQLATGLTGKFCSKFCKANVPPPPSPEEPAP